MPSAAYAVFWASARAGMPYVIAVIFGVLICVIVGVGMERFGYRTLAKQAGPAALLAIFVASLGLAIAGENVIRLTFSSASQQIVVARACARRSTGGRRRSAGSTCGRCCPGWRS